MNNIQDIYEIRLDKSYLIEQRYRCKDCGCPFVLTRHKGKNQEPERYFENAKETISNYKDEINFYLSNSELVFFFNSYDIAPYAGGSPSFSIPFKGNENLFNKRIITNNN